MNNNCIKLFQFQKESTIREKIFTYKQTKILQGNNPTKEHYTNDDILSDLSSL